MTDQLHIETAEEQRNLAAVAAVLPYWNAHDVDGVLTFYDPQIRWTNNPMDEVYRGHQQVAEYLGSLFTAFPDLVFSVRHRIARGDEVAEEWTLRGTHRGEYLGVPATGRVITIDGMSLVRMRDGRFLADSFYFDAAGVMRQFGLLPSLAAGRSPAARWVLALVVGGRNSTTRLRRRLSRSGRSGHDDARPQDIDVRSPR